MGFFSRSHPKDTVACPYCGCELAEMPERKKKCPHCGDPIFVRTTPAERKRVLVTERQATEIDRQWDERNKMNRLASTFGVDEREFEQQKRELSKRFGKEASTDDVVWSILNKRVIDAMKSGDCQELKMLYYEQALILHERGKDFFPVLQESAKAELRRYHQMGITKVEILGDRDCSTCAPQNGRVLGVGEALETLPVPAQDCKNGFCRCQYLAVVE